MQMILINQSSNDYSVKLLYVISIISVFLGIYTIISKNPVVSILFLIGLFFTMSLYLITIGLHFIGLSYLLVYVGAVSMLFLFILMLINIRVSELITDNNNSIPLAIIIIVLFNYCISNSVPYSVYGDILTFDVWSLFDSIYSGFNSTKAYVINIDFISSILHYNSLFTINEVYSLSWENIMVSSSHISSIGNILYTNLFILFIVTSLIILLAMVGAIMVAITNSKGSKHDI